MYIYTVLEDILSSAYGLPVCLASLIPDFYLCVKYYKILIPHCTRVSSHWATSLFIQLRQ